MSNSLQDQLMGAGLIDKKKAKALSKEKRQKAKQAPKGHKQVDEVKEAVKQNQAAKAERAKQLNIERQLIVEAKAISAQIKQLIDDHKISRSGGQVAYSFTHDKKIKKFYVTDELQGQLARGQIAVVVKQSEAKDEKSNQYELVPQAVAEKIAQRDDSLIVLQNTRSVATEVDEEDPYADFQVPDDLMW